MIAVPIATKKIKDALKQIALANETADVIELRLDYFLELSETDLKSLLKKCTKPVICTCRLLEEGGNFRESESKRIAVLKKAMKLKTDYIDVEYETKKENLKKILDYRKKYKCKIILSKHYFRHTPSLDDLLKIMDKMHKLKPDVIKIITKANALEDNTIILSLLKEGKRKGIDIIAFCMGNIGKHSRILSMPLGAFLTFASLEEGSESAEGQIPVGELKKIYAGLRVMF